MISLIKSFNRFNKESDGKSMVITTHEHPYFVFEDTILNDAYKPGDGNIRYPDEGRHNKRYYPASDNSNLEALAKTVTKYILCYKKELAVG